MSVAQSSVHWKRLMEPRALPAWITLGWKLVNALSNIEYLHIHLGGVWRFFVTPLGNVLLIIAGFLWLGVVVFWHRNKEEPRDPVDHDATGEISSKPRLIVHSALYGVGDGTDVQIADKLNGLSRTGMTIPVNRTLVPYDPAPGKAKSLKVAYSFDGVQHDPVSVADDYYLMLPQDPQLRALRAELEKAATTIATLKKPPDDLHLQLLCFQTGTTLSLEERVYFIQLKISCDEDTGIKGIKIFVTIGQDVFTAEPMDSGALSEWLIHIPVKSITYPHKTFSEEELTSHSLWDELQRDGLRSGLAQEGWMGIKINKGVLELGDPSQMQIDITKSKDRNSLPFIFSTLSECEGFRVIDRAFREH